MEKFLPNDFLKPFVQSFLIIESEEGMENRILPGASVILSFRIRGEINVKEEGSENPMPLSGIAGLRKHTRTVIYSKGAATLLVVFKEGGAASFFEQPIHEIFGVNVSLDHLVHPNKIREIEEKLFEANANPKKISLVENFLISELKTFRSDSLILNTIGKIRSAKGNLKIQDLLLGMPISWDSFEKKFRSTVGATPKQFSGLVRMRNLIDHYAPESSLTDTALEAGYFDQAHFIKDFKIFTGQTPKEFFKSARYW